MGDFMKKLRVSTQLAIHPYSKDDISEYIRLGLARHQELGFDAVDFTIGFDFLEKVQDSIIEKALTDS